MAPDERVVKFSATLHSLLHAPGQAGSRKELAEHLGVSDATVSHYVRERAKPSFDVLVGIARFFNVSLDYLVFGERPLAAVAEDVLGVRSEIRRAMLESADRAGRHLDIVARISRRLQGEIERAANELLDDPANLGPAGFITNAEAVMMESSARRVRTITRKFQSDVNVYGEPGVFFESVTRNLRAGVQYEYLLCGEVADWRPRVTAYRKLLDDAGLPFEVLHNCLHFRVVDYEVPAALCILDLDIPGLQRTQPILWERQRESISAEGYLAYASVERPDAQGGVVLEPGYRESAYRLFERGWREAADI